MPRVELRLLLVAALLGGCDRLAPPPRTTQPARTNYDDQYVDALAAADAFCHAWQRREGKAGRALLSKRFLRTYPDIQITDAIVGQPLPAHAAYEIASGKRLADGRYSFDVRLFFLYSGLHGDKIEPVLNRVVVIRDDAGNWKIDEFPVPPTPPDDRTGPIVSPAAG